MSTTSTAAKGAGIVLATLAAAQFLMALDSSVMNVSIASVAEDVGTTVTGVQTAITLYTLVMASLMITGGKLGAMFGRKRMFVLGIVIYACGSLTTAIAPNLTVLILGWSFLEGIGAALIMPAVVALVAGNVPPAGRTAAYGLIAAAAAMAVAAGPIIGGFVTTSFSWRWVFAGEVVVAAAILVLSRRVADAEPEGRPHLDLVGVALSIAGLAAVVLGFLKSGSWGWVTPKPDAPEVLGLSPVIWLISGGLLCLWLLLRWLHHVEDRGGEPLFAPGLLGNRRLTGGLSLFGVQYFMQAGVFFTIPLFLSIVLGLSAFETGLRLLPLSIGLLATAIGVPRVAPHASPRRVVRIGTLLMLAGTAVLISGLEVGANAAIVSLPLLLIGLGIGAMASQLGAVVVSAVPEDEAPAVGGLQNTVMNLGASMGTALVGSLLIGALSASLASGVNANPAIPQSVKDEASVALASGIPFLSDAQLEEALAGAGVDEATTAEIVDENEKARYDGLRVALSAVLLVGILGLFLSGAIPGRQPGAARAGPEPEPAAA
ncbi:MAG: MFS transporter [Solirubrobacteraceae bacterium]|nr:MFS transporter [Solirubrobacteraceae bacterium]